MSSVLRDQLRNLKENNKAVIDLAELGTYKKLINTHRDFSFICELEGIILEINGPVEKLTGYQKEEWVNKPFSHFKPMAEQWQSTISLIEELQIETYSLLHKEGHLIDFEKTSIPISHNNSIIGFLVVARDISTEKKQEQELRKVQESLNYAQMVGNTGSWDYDVIEDEAYWSSHLYRMLGIEDVETFVPTYSCFLSFIHPQDRERFNCVWQTSVKNGNSFQIEFRLIKQDGTNRIVRMQGDVIIDENGKAVRVIGTIQDLTEQRQIEKLLQDSEEQKSIIYDNLDVAIWSMDMVTNEMIFLTKGVESIYGYSVQEMQEDQDLWKKVIHPEDYSAAVARKNDLYKGKSNPHHYRIYHSSGAVKWVLDHTIPVQDSDGKLIRVDGIISDITDQKQAEEKMSYLAHHDALTGLPNRRKFDQMLQTVLSEPFDQRFAILYLNLDRFKRINDTLGHFIGDELLKEVSSRLRSLVPEKESLSRMDGDEFAIFIRNGDLRNGPELLAEEVLQSIQEPFLIKGYELYITTSIGVSYFPENGESMDVLMSKSIVAMNRAKQLGKNNCQLYSHAMGEGSFNIFSIENDMRKALKNDEFSVYYQPRVCTNTGKILSAEALIRWNHPKKGFISPGEFIPLAEENGLIFKISDWVAVNVCKQLKKWQDEQLPVTPISINVPAQRFLKKNLVSKLKALISETQISPELIELEITESSYLNNMELVIQALAELREMGIKIALDDFGTGFSSLTHLKELNIDTLKIDRSFIKHITDKEQDRVITSSIIQLAHGLKVEVVAEGVETEEQLDLLRQKGCDQIQGFLFSRPVPAIEFRGLLEKGYLETSVMNQTI